MPLLLLLLRSWLMNYFCAGWVFWISIIPLLWLLLPVVEVVVVACLLACLILRRFCPFAFLSSFSMDGWWWLMMVDDVWWWLMMVDDGWWWLMMDDDGWWCLMMDDDGWWLIDWLIGSSCLLLFVVATVCTNLWYCTITVLREYRSIRTYVGRRNNFVPYFLFHWVTVMTGEVILRSWEWYHNCKIIIWCNQTCQSQLTIFFCSWY